MFFQFPVPSQLSHWRTDNTHACAGLGFIIGRIDIDMREERNNY